MVNQSREHLLFTKGTLHICISKHSKHRTNLNFCDWYFVKLKSTYRKSRCHVCTWIAPQTHSSLDRNVNQAENWLSWEQRTGQVPALLKSHILYPSSTVTTWPMALLHYYSMTLCRDTNLNKIPGILVCGLISPELFFWVNVGTFLEALATKNTPHKICSISNSVWNFWNSLPHNSFIFI